MTPLPPELEALMPEPIRAFRDKGTFTMEEYLFTADQVRQAMLDATERAAKKCEALAILSDKPVHNERDCAEAIRGDGGQGS
jgi:hypothetical protein